MNIALLLAAGSGNRMNNPLPKQFIVVNGKHVFEYSLETFANHDEIDAIVLVTSKEYLDKVKEWCKGINKIKDIVVGGSSRQESVFNGLKAIKEFAKDDDIVLIHDTARPLVSSKIISDNIELVKTCDAVTTAIKASDTTVDVKEKFFYLDRSHLCHFQTPQTFKLGLALRAHVEIKEEATDDSALISKLGLPVHIADGSKKNFKITTEEDLELFKSIIEK